MDDFRHLGEEKSNQIQDLKVSRIGLEAKLQVQYEPRAEMKRWLAAAESRAKGE